ncbi:23222_t:CDS:10 [Dentiscutata erythropus]|uniref:23222_t:CDS:1 n=1 Tax=Dentiscutata erythropus TaxID=1348616 RepID=A0A9N9D3S5_9GLOM|nr:23222_t:CDS:10 [Dentiscutata erythropus]
MEQPSRIEYMKRGALMGGAVGVCLGFVFGTYHILRYGPNQAGYLSTLSRYMVSSAGSFALFMGIGSFIRSEQSKNIMLKQYLEQHQKNCSRGFANIPVEVLERKRWDRKLSNVELCRFWQLLTIMASINDDRHDPVAYLMAGATSGLMSCILLQPFDLVKTRLQQERQQYIRLLGRDQKVMPMNSRIIYKVKEIIAKESIFGLWRGTIPTIFRNVPGTALYYFTLSEIRLLFSLRHRISSSSPIPQRPTSGSSLPVLSDKENLIAGMVARGSIGFVMMPITVVKVRYESNFYNYKSIWDALSSIIKTDGFKGLFYGYGATAIKDAPTSGLNVLFYERFKLKLQDYSPSLSPTITHMIAGTFSGSLSAFITHPFDVLKTRIQLKPSEYSNIFLGASKVLKVIVVLVEFVINFKSISQMNLLNF